MAADFIDDKGNGAIGTHLVAPQGDGPAVPSHFGALCIRKCKCADQRGVEVLLITSRASGRWVIPKGRPMRHRKPHQVARREAWEEAGVRGVVRKTPCGHFSYLKTLPQGGVAPCIVQVHLLDVARMRPIFPEMNERRLRWFCPQDAAAAVHEPELSALLIGITTPADANRSL